MMRRIISACAVLLLTLSASVFADNVPSGADILARTTEVMQSDSRTMSLTMVLVNDRGQERSRTVKVWSASDDDGDKMLLRFEEPRDVAGTGFLVVGDDMWLYLPALRQTRRIAGHAKSGSFMGSDLSYEDMETLISTGFATYDAHYVADETVGGEQTHQLRLYPTEQNSYDYLDMWVSAATSLPRRIHYVRDDTTVKSLTTNDFEQIEGRWTATEIVMETVAKKTRTRLRIDAVSFESMDGQLFSVRYLERGVR